MEDFLGIVLWGLIIWGVIAWQKRNKENKEIFYNIRRNCTKYISNKYKEYAKCVPVNTHSYLLVDDKEKIFKIDTYINRVLGRRIDITRLLPCEVDAIKNDFSERYKRNFGFNGDDIAACFSLVNEDKIKFDDLIKIDIIDQTTVNTTRQFTMESKTGDSLVGAFLGDALIGGLNGGTIGAIAGASSKRNITEETFVDKEIAFDIVLYLNRLNDNTLTINVNDEKKLRELVGIFQYILNNKTKE